jgi:hypothetical protein
VVALVALLMPLMLLMGSSFSLRLMGPWSAMCIDRPVALDELWSAKVSGIFRLCIDFGTKHAP